MNTLDLPLTEESAGVGTCTLHREVTTIRPTHRQELPRDTDRAHTPNREALSRVHIMPVIPIIYQFII